MTDPRTDGDYGGSKLAMAYIPTDSELRGLAIGREVINRAWQLEHANRPLTDDEQQVVDAGVFLRKLAPYLGEDGLRPMTDADWTGEPC